MICHLCERALFMHAHGELGGAERFLLQCHLEGCDACRARWAKSVVEKDQLRRALSPVPTLDPEGERRLQIIGARIRTEQRPDGTFATSPAPASVPARHTLGRGRKVAGFALAMALLAITLTAMAAAWGPSLGGVFGAGTGGHSLFDPAKCVADEHCLRCQLTPPNAPAGNTPGACMITPSNAPAVSAAPVVTPAAAPAVPATTAAATGGAVKVPAPSPAPSSCASGVK